MLLATIRALLRSREAERALRESEARFRAMADSAPVMIWLGNNRGGAEWFSRSWIEFTGRPLEAWRESVAELHDRGVEHVWLRAGADGSWLCSRDREPVHLPAVPATVVDVTGAGDAMLAAWVAAWLRGADPVAAAREGHRAAAATIESPHTVRPDLAAVLTSPDTSIPPEEHP